MKKIRIFSEGKADVKFLKDLIQKMGLTNDKLSYRKLEGIGGMKNTLQFEESTFEGNHNIVILDADEDFIKRENEITKLKTQTGIEFDFFLIPNNCDNGNLEDLLFKLIKEEHLGVLDCFDTFEKCLTSLNKGYFGPEKKDKVFAYLDAIKGKKGRENFKPDRRDYNDSDLWDLDIEYLEPLKQFLNNCFK